MSAQSTTEKPAETAPVYQPHDYWNARLEKEFSLAGVGHASVGLKFNRWAYQIRRKVLVRTLSDLGISIRDAKMLELAFGTGFYLDLWRELGVKSVYGVDIADVAVKSALERFKGLNWRLETGDIGQPLPLGEFTGSCEVTTAFDVLFHLTEDASWNGALDNLTAALKPGGHVIIFDKFQREETGVSHVKRRTLVTYQAALEKRGLEIRTIRPIFFFMNSPTDLSFISKLFFKTGWSLVKTPYKVGKKLGCAEALGGMTGALLYGPELLLGKLFSSGPSTKILVARKK